MAVTKGWIKGRLKRTRTERAMPAQLQTATTAADHVDLPARSVLALDGAGPPDDPAFELGMGALFGVAYTLKLARRKAKPSADSFEVGPLEARWWADATAPVPDAPRASGRWQLRISVPDDVSSAEVAASIETTISRSGGKLAQSKEATRVRLVRLGAATAGRILHVGPLSGEAPSLEAARAALREAGLSPGRAHLEVYLGDPRHTAPERLRTVLLVEASARQAEPDAQRGQAPLPGVIPASPVDSPRSRPRRRAGTRAGARS